MYEITVTRKFFATHAVTNYKGGTEEPHEHEWRVDICIAAKELDEAGLAADFCEVDPLITEIIAPINGDVANVTPGKSPSAENLSRYIFDTLAAHFEGRTMRVTKVTSWEDADHGAAYFFP